jgi:tyrosine-protein kinase Etk/Wzc
MSSFQDSAAVGQEKPVDLKQAIYQYLIHPWYLYLIGLLICVGAAWLYLRYATRQYQASCSLLVKTPDSGAEGIQETFLLEEVGAISSLKNIENEIQVLKSRSMMREVVDRLQLNIKYESQGRVRIGELYKRSPVLVDSFQVQPKLNSTRLEIEPAGDQVLIRQGDLELGTAPFDSLFQCSLGVFRFRRNPPLPFNGKLYISFLDPDPITRYYAAQINARRIGEYSTVLELSLRDPVPEKAADILNTLTATYNSFSVREKNQKWFNTYAFINDRLTYLTAELSEVEGNVEQFKRRNTLPSGIETDVQLITESFRQNDQAISKIDLERSLLVQLEQLLLRQKDSLSLLPINFVFDQSDLNQQALEYNKLIQEEKTTAGVGEPQTQPPYANVESQIRPLKKCCLPPLRALAKTWIETAKTWKPKNNDIQGRIRSLPGIERELIEITRQKNIKENLYLYLLQKREEAALSMAVSLADAKVIDAAEPPTRPVAPQSSLIYTLALLLGLGIPLALDCAPGIIK